MKGKQVGMMVASFGCLALFLVVSVVFNAVSLGEVPSSFIGAALGAVITGVITVVLLQGQTAAEEDKERNVKVFEKKSEVFQAYIQTVWGIWEDQKVTSEEFQSLTTGYYRDLMIYLDDSKLFGAQGKAEKPSLIIAEAIGKIGGCLDRTDIASVETLRECITLIINVLSNQIGLGGQIRADIIKKHDEQMFPVFFRKTLLEALNASLARDSGLLHEGCYETQEFDGLQYAAFYFKKFANCKLVVGPVAYSVNWKHVAFALSAGWQYGQVDAFRAAKRGPRKVLLNTNILLDTAPAGDYEPVLRDLNLSDVGINLEDRAALEPFRGNYRQVCAELARRARFWFEETRIDGKSIPEFLEHHLGNR